MFEDTTYYDSTSSCYEEQSWFAIAVGIFLAIGIWVSWLPQQVEFFMVKRTYGVSGMFIFLTQIANWFPVINIFLSDYSYFNCCTTITFGQCNVLLLPIYIFVLSAFSTTCIHLFYVIYYNPNPPPKAESEDTFKVDSEPVITVGDKEYPVLGERELKIQRQLNVIGFIVYLLAMVLMFIFAWELILITGVGSSIVVIYADALGITGTIVVLIQFVPQIYLTYCIKAKGSLSLVMLIIQTPGTWVLLLYYVLAGEVWSVWLSTSVAAVSVTILFGLVLWYEYIKPKNGPLRLILARFIPSMRYDNNEEYALN